MRMEPGRQWRGQRQSAGHRCGRDTVRLVACLVAICCALVLICPDAASAATSDKKRPVKTTIATVKKQPAKASQNLRRFASQPPAKRPRPLSRQRRAAAKKHGQGQAHCAQGRSTPAVAKKSTVRTREQTGQCDETISRPHQAGYGRHQGRDEKGGKPTEEGHSRHKGAGRKTDGSQSNGPSGPPSPPRKPNRKGHCREKWRQQPGGGRPRPEQGAVTGQQVLAGPRRPRRCGQPERPVRPGPALLFR